MTACFPTPTCDETNSLKEKAARLEAWRISSEAEHREVHDVTSQVKNLITPANGGSGSSRPRPALPFMQLETGKR